MPLNRTYIRDLVRDAKGGDADSIARVFTLLLHPFPSDKLDEREAYYRYEIQRGASQYYPVLQVLKAMIADLTSKDIGVASIPYQIFPADDAPVVWPPSEDPSYLATKFYTIKDNNLFPMTVPISVFPRYPNYPPPTPETVKIFHGGEWQLFKDWLPGRTADISVIGGRGTRRKASGGWRTTCTSIS